MWVDTKTEKLYRILVGPYHHRKLNGKMMKQARRERDRMRGRERKKEKKDNLTPTQIYFKCIHLLYFLVDCGILLTEPRKYLVDTKIS